MHALRGGDPQEALAALDHLEAAVMQHQVPRSTVRSENA
jgi:hypothetical protein